MGRYENASYVSATLEFRCNLRCVHCMIEGTMDRLQPVSDEAFEHVLRSNQETRQYRGLIMTGSEITLRRDLPDLARRARAAGFEHIRIQTHGMHLSRPGYAEQLIEAGVDEFFVSVAGSDAATHDGITMVNGSFEKMLRGMEIVSSFPGTAIITNTVVTERSYRLLPGVIDALSGISALSQMEFWHYFPMSRTDEKLLMADYRLIVPYLRQACERADARGIGVEIKNVPQCLLGPDDWRLDNGQAALLIDPDFWIEFDKNGFYRCPHRDRCASKSCLGLTEAYIARFGNMADDLSPYLTVNGGRPEPIDVACAGYVSHVNNQYTQ